MDDGVRARVLLVSHCLLNPFSAVKGRRTPKDTARYAVAAAVEAGVGLLQLPCPEFTWEGPNRWAKSFEQYDNAFYRRHCDELVAPVMEQLVEYVRDGTEVVGVIGVGGSPSCGAYQVAKGEDWGGCFDPAADGGPWEPPPIVKEVGRGVFLDALTQAIEAAGWEVPVVAVPKDTADAETLEKFRRAVRLMVGAAGAPGAEADDWDESEDWEPVQGERPSP